MDRLKKDEIFNYDVLTDTWSCKHLFIDEIYLKDRKLNLANIADDATKLDRYLDR